MSDFEDGKREGIQAATLETVTDDLKEIHSKLDKVIEDHGNRLTKIETTAAVFKWIFGVLGLTTIGTFFKSP